MHPFFIIDLKLGTITIKGKFLQKCSRKMI